MTAQAMCAGDVHNAVWSRPRSIPWLALSLVSMLAVVNFVFNLAEPRGTVWDESYYLSSTQRYFEGIAQFASHPPLGLMLIAAGEAALHPNSEIDTRALGRDKRVTGNTIPAGFSFAGVRLASASFAVLGAIGFFALMYLLTQSTFTALVFSNLFTFENAFTTQFRAAHLDAFEIAFTTLALLCYVLSVRRGIRPSVLLECGFGAACGLAMMVKLNAMVLLALGLMRIVHRVALGWTQTPRRALVLLAARDISLMSASCVTVILATFAIHVSIGSRLPDPNTVAGQQDGRFLSAEYRQYLEGRRPLSPQVLWHAANDYRQFMANDFEHTPLKDPNASNPLEWPLGHGTINYRWDSDGSRTEYVQLLGNPVSGILALLAPFGALALLILQWWRPTDSSDPARRALMGMLLIEYAAFMVLHSYLGTHRVMYLYHYFIGLLLAFSLFPLIFQELTERYPAVRRRETHALVTLTALILCSFVFYAPLNYHRPLTHAQCEWRNLFQHVVDCR